MSSTEPQLGYRWEQGEMDGWRWGGLSKSGTPDPLGTKLCLRPKTVSEKEIHI